MNAKRWNWYAFFFGPFWYLANKMILKGVLMLFLSTITFGFGIPLIWIYCGFQANEDWHERQLKEKGIFDINKI